MNRRKTPISTTVIGVFLRFKKKQKKYDHFPHLGEGQMKRMGGFWDDRNPRYSLQDKNHLTG